MVSRAWPALEQTFEPCGKARSKEVVPDSREAIGVLRRLRGAVERHSSASELRDQANQRDPVPLTERWSERLTMIREDHELVTAPHV